MRGILNSINISSDGGVPKFPINEVNILFQGMEGDFNKFRMSKGGGDLDRAITLFSLEIIHLLQEEGHPIKVGSTGENLTVEGIDWSKLKQGMKISVGECIIQLSEPCAPCSKIGGSFNDRKFSRIDHSLEFGWSRWLARVLVEGKISVGDSISFLS
tara:strand:- start:1803 stop:2273 length:471 start_codon:yes stop_codon:yes gene_type:complete